MLTHAHSNRSAALLKLLKVTKAIEDADMCIKLKPEWEKVRTHKHSPLYLAACNVQCPYVDTIGGRHSCNALVFIQMRMLTLCMCVHVCSTHICRVGQNHIHGVYTAS
jgi:hypothetical protein